MGLSLWIAWICCLLRHCGSSFVVTPIDLVASGFVLVVKLDLVSVCSFSIMYCCCLSSIFGHILYFPCSINEYLFLKKKTYNERKGLGILISQYKIVSMDSTYLQLDTEL